MTVKEEMVVTRESEHAPARPKVGEDPDAKPAKPKLTPKQALRDLREYHRPKVTSGVRTTAARKAIQKGATARLNELRKHAADPPEVDSEAHEKQLERVQTAAAARGLAVAPDLAPRRPDAVPSGYHAWCGRTQVSPGHPNRGVSLSEIEDYLSTYSEPPTLQEVMRMRELVGRFKLGEGGRQRGPVHHGPERLKSIGAEHSERETVRDD